MGTKFFSLFVAIFSMALFSISEAICNIVLESKITANDAAAGDSFGDSVSISGDHAIVGAPQEDQGRRNSGSAYIFARDTRNGVWGQVAKISAFDAIFNELFGISVSISGDHAIVGAPQDDEGGHESGAVYIFERDTDSRSWLQVAKITASDAEEFDNFGQSVAISGDHAIVGAGGGPARGGFDPAYIIERNVDSGAWMQVAKLAASDAAANDGFGSRISIFGNHAIVGAPLDDDGGNASGSAYIFEKDVDNGAWTEVTKLTASDAAALNFFGTSVSISSDHVIVGAIGSTNFRRGSAYIFEKNVDTGIWSQVAKITGPDPDKPDFFGTPVSISGGHAIVGAILDDEGGILAPGVAYLFERDMLSGAWSRVQKITAFDPTTNDNFGHSISISGGHAIIGVPGDDDDGDQSGSAYIYNIMAPIMLPPIADATIKRSSPTTNFSADGEVEVDASSRKDFLMMFEVSGVGDRNVRSAKLRLFCSNGSDQGGEFHRVTSDWVEDGVTWDNAPPAEPDVIASLGPVVRNTWVEVDITPLITGDGLHSLRVMSMSANGADYRSREKEELAPQLIIKVEERLEDTLTIMPTDDATVKLDSPAENFGAVREVEVDARSRKDFLMTFDVSGIGDRTVVNAKLRLFCTDGSNQGGDFHEIDTDWSEDSVTWDNAPPADPDVIASLGPVVRNTWVEVDLSFLITGDGIYSLRVDSTSANGADYRSKERPGLEPELILTVR